MTQVEKLHDIIRLQSKTIFLLKTSNHYLMGRATPISFRNAVEKLLNEKISSNVLTIETLKELSSYFSSFHHKKQDNDEIDKDDMEEYIQVLFQSSNIVKIEYSEYGICKTIELDMAIFQELIRLLDF